MRKTAWISTITGIIGPATTAVAASGAEYEGSSALMIMFMGFGALIIAFQGILVALLFFSMVRALFTKPVKDTPALATEHSKQS